MLKKWLKYVQSLPNVRRKGEKQKLPHWEGERGGGQDGKLSHHLKSAKTRIKPRNINKLVVPTTVGTTE